MKIHPQFVASISQIQEEIEKIFISYAYSSRLWEREADQTLYAKIDKLNLLKFKQDNYILNSRMRTANYSLILIKLTALTGTLYRLLPHGIIIIIINVAYS